MADVRPHARERRGRRGGRTPSAEQSARRSRTLFERLEPRILLDAVGIDDPTVGDLLYDPQTGGVWLDATDTPDGVIRSISLRNKQQAFNAPGVAQFPADVISFDTPQEIGWFNANPVAFSGIWYLGPVFPENLEGVTLDQLLTEAVYLGMPGSVEAEFDLLIGTPSGRIQGNVLADVPLFDSPLTLTPLDGWRVYLDLDDDGEWSEGEPFDLTDDQGAYRIESEPGDYILRQELPTDWYQQVPVQGQGDEVVVEAGAVSTVKFINRRFSEIQSQDFFYDNSIFDQFTPGPNPNDSQAIAPGKQALLPGQTADPSHYSNYVKGINGIMIDVDWLYDLPDVDDFRFLMGNNCSVDKWEDAPLPQQLSVESEDTGYRITLTWSEDAVTNHWLRTEVRNDGQIIMPTDHVFYFGNAVADIGNSSQDTVVNMTEVLAWRDHRTTLADPAPIGEPHDVNRDGLVNNTDLLIIFDRLTTRANDLNLITAPDAEVIDLLKGKPGPPIDMDSQPPRLADATGETDPLVTISTMQYRPGLSVRAGGFSSHGLDHLLNHLLVGLNEYGADKTNDDPHIPWLYAAPVDDLFSGL